MKRLTRLCKDTENGTYIPYVAGTFVGIYPNCTLGEVVQRLAYYEDLEEQGRLVVLPCKIGQTLFVVGSRCLADDFPDEECEIYNCDDCPYDKEFVVFEEKATKDLVFKMAKNNDNFFIFGETVFNTYEEAERKLKELQGY